MRKHESQITPYLWGSRINLFCLTECLICVHILAQGEIDMSQVIPDFGVILVEAASFFICRKSLRISMKLIECTSPVMPCNSIVGNKPDCHFICTERFLITMEMKKRIPFVKPDCGIM